MTVPADRWVEALRLRGYDFASMVPCSILDPLIDGFERSDAIDLVTASSEGEAIGVAVGAWLAGRKPIVLCQNSGLGNAVNPLTSLAWPAAAPMLMFVSWRGEPGRADAPQHELMGRITLALLGLLEIPTEPLPRDPDEVDASLDRAEASMAVRRRPWAFVVRRGSVTQAGPPSRAVSSALGSGSGSGGDDMQPVVGAPELSRREVIALCHELLPDHALLASTGKIGRELYELGDDDRVFYNVGAMGCVAGIGLGVSLARPDRGVCVLDGDGSLLMRLGTLATVGHRGPRNYIHVVLDNERHESTGGQPSASSTVDFARLALGASYRRAWAASSRADIVAALRRASGVDGPTLLHFKVGVQTSPSLARPEYTPREVASRFRRWLGGPGAIA